MARLTNARNDHISRWVLPAATRLLIESASIGAKVRPLGSVAHIEMGQSPSGDSVNDKREGLPLIGGPSDLGLVFPATNRWTQTPTKICKPGDIVVCVRATIGEPRWADNPYCLGRGVAGIRTKDTDLDAGFLFRLIESNEDALRAKATGTTFKTISRVHLADIAVPIIALATQKAISSFLQWLEENSGGRPNFSEAPILPESLSEQRRIVARIEALAAKIEARALRHRAAEQAEALQASSRLTMFSTLENRVTVGSTCEVIDPNPSHRYPAYVDESVPIVSSSEFIGEDGIDPRLAKRVPPSFYEATPGRFGVGEGDVIFSRKGKVGYARLHPGNVKLAMTHTLCVLKPENSTVDSRYLLHFARSPMFLEELTGTMNPNVGVPTLGLGVIRDASIPLPPLDQQRRIVADLDALQAEVDALKRLQAETSAELDALLPSILDRAFKGDL